MSLKKFAIAAGLSLVMLLGAGCTQEGQAVKKVASIDEAVIYKLDEFKNAEEELKKFAEERKKKLLEEGKDKSPDEQQKLSQQFQMELQKKQNELLNPLKEKARAAVANAAKDKGVTVVLDKKIVVYGVPDITDDVKTLMTSGGELSYPKEEADVETAPVGYFDQGIVRSLKVFQQGEAELIQERNKMLAEWKASLGDKKPTPAEIQGIQKTIETRLQSIQEQKFSPLLKAVTDSVEEVAKKEGLSLVLDTQHVMYGGRNLTENVVDTFLKKVGADPTKGGAADSKPMTIPTPAPAEK